MQPIQQRTAAEQNYKMACALSAIESAMKKLMELDIAVHDIHVDLNGLTFLITDDALACPDIVPVSRIRHADGMEIYRATLCGALLQWQVYASQEVA